MRTTINLPDDVYELASSLARTRQISLGDAVAELVRRPTPEPQIRTDRGFPYFEVPDAANPPKVTMEEISRAIDQLNDEEDLRKAFPARR